MSKRKYDISRKSDDNMYTCWVRDNNGLESTNYFDTEQECINHVYWKWENEEFFQENSMKMLEDAIWGCTKLDEKLGLLKGNRDNLD